MISGHFLIISFYSSKGFWLFLVHCYWTLDGLKIADQSWMKGFGNSHLSTINIMNLMNYWIEYERFRFFRGGIQLNSLFEYINGNCSAFNQWILLKD